MEYLVISISGENATSAVGLSTTIDWKSLKIRLYLKGTQDGSSADSTVSAFGPFEKQ
jgi:hypothetical protein